MKKVKGEKQRNKRRIAGEREKRDWRKGNTAKLIG